VTESQIQASVLDRFGLRIEKPMAQFAMEKMPGAGEIALIGVDARTGVPRRQIVATAAIIPTNQHR
jgi:hypothetical protein